MGRCDFGVEVFFVLLLLLDELFLLLLLPPLDVFAPEVLALLPLAEVAFVSVGTRAVPRGEAGDLDRLARCSARVLCIDRSLGSLTALLASRG